MARRSGELQELCRQLGLQQDGTREMLMDRIRDAIVVRDSLRILPQVAPMSAQNGKDFLDYDLEKPWRSAKLMEYWNSSDWVIEPKLDGVRVKAHFHPGYDPMPRLDSRRRSDTHFAFSEQTANFPHLACQYPPPDTILDGELVQPAGVNKIWNGAMWVEGLQICTSIWNSGTETSLNLQQYCYHPTNELIQIPEQAYWMDDGGNARGCLLQYWAFDIIRYNGEWLHEKPLHFRRALLVDVVATIRKENPNYHFVPQWELNSGFCEDGELEWDDPELGRLGEFEALVEAGGEGVMFKYKHSPYQFGKRTWDWLKLKQFSELSGFIIGATDSTVGKGWENMIGGFQVGVYQGEEIVHVASCSAMPLEMRKAATITDEAGKPKLNPEFLNRVVEVRYQVMTTRNIRGRHAVIVRWRDDQGPHDCNIDQVKAAPSEIMDSVE